MFLKKSLTFVRQSLGVVFVLDLQLSASLASPATWHHKHPSIPSITSITRIWPAMTAAMGQLLHGPFHSRSLFHPCQPRQTITKKKGSSDRVANPALVSIRLASNHKHKKIPYLKSGCQTDHHQAFKALDLCILRSACGKLSDVIVCKMV